MEEEEEDDPKSGDEGTLNLVINGENIGVSENDTKGVKPFPTLVVVNIPGFDSEKYWDTDKEDEKEKDEYKGIDGKQRIKKVTKHSADNS